MRIAVWLEAFVLGISTGPLCIASCAPVLVPFFASTGKTSVGTDVKKMGLFMTGRLAGYLIVGLAAGLLGKMTAAFFDKKIESIASIVMGALLLAFGIVRNFPRLRLCEIFRTDKSTGGFAFVFGIVTGVSICPPFLAAFTAGASFGNVGLAILYFLFFFFGTSVFIFPLFLSGFMGRMEELKAGARVCLLLAGVWFVGKGVLGLLL